MPAGLACLLLLAAPVKVASTGFTGTGVDTQLVRALDEKAGQTLAQSPKLSVITRGDVELVLGVERQKQLLGCVSDSSACMAELAGALGADLVLSGDIARIGTRYSATLKLLAARTGHVIYSGAADAGGEDDLLAGVVRLARAAREQVAPSGVTWQPAVAVALGAAAAGVGAWLLVRANQNVSAIAALDASAPDALVHGARLRDDGKLWATLGTVSLAVGGAALVGAVLAWLWPTPPVQLALAPTSTGVGLALSGSLW